MNKKNIMVKDKNGKYNCSKCKKDFSEFHTEKDTINNFYGKPIVLPDMGIVKFFCPNCKEEEFVVV